MSEGPRVSELRRRVEKDPASIAFAPLAEELRKTGQNEEAVRLCRAGLEHHPTYISARVTLGRALLDLDEYTEARVELEQALRAAPDNLVALKCMSELRQRAGDAPIAPVSMPEAARIVEPALPMTLPAPQVDPIVAALEQWHARIHADRARRSSETPAQGQGQ